MNMLDIETTTCDDVEYTILQIYNLVNEGLVIDVINKFGDIHGTYRRAYGAAYDKIRQDKDDK